MAVGLDIIALLLAGLLVPLTTQVNQRQNSGTQKAFDEIKEALTEFAIANGYLPCTDRAIASLRERGGLSRRREHEW